MPNPTPRLFFPIAVWRTRRGEITLQRELITAPDTVEELRELITAQAVEPAERGSYCVQFAGGGHYFSDYHDTLEYLCRRWGERFILRNLDKALTLAATRQDAALAEAHEHAKLWQNLEKAGGETP